MTILSKERKIENAIRNRVYAQCESQRYYRYLLLCSITEFHFIKLMREKIIFFSLFVIVEAKAYFFYHQFIRRSLYRCFSILQSRGMCVTHEKKFEHTSEEK